MNSYTRLIGALSIVVPFMMLMFSAPIAAQQNVRATLFEDANNALNAARSIQAEALGPKNFSKAIEYYRHAEKDYEKGKNLESIRQDLIACVSHCKLSVAAATVAKTTLPHAIKARSDALKADAATFAPKNWTDAEEKFIDATRDLEAGRIAGAKKRAGDAEVMFRNAELIAIKESSLRDTWALLKQADKKM